MTLLSYDGYCPICEAKTTFNADNEWFRDSLLCRTCGSIPRERALAHTVTRLYPGWRDMAIHECSPVMRGFSLKLKNECKKYIPTHYFPDRGPAEMVRDFRNENIEAQTFSDGTFDLVISLDVMEHLYNPDKAYSEVWRTLKPGGAYIHTFPIRKYQVEAVVDRATLNQDGTVTHLVEKPEYHGNPIDPSGGSLVTKDYGYDISGRINEWAPFDVQICRFWNRTHGIIGEYTEVVVCKRDGT